MVAPPAEHKIYLRVLACAVIEARHLSSAVRDEPSELRLQQINDLMDAIHNISQLIERGTLTGATTPMLILPATCSGGPPQVQL